MATNSSEPSKRHSRLVCSFVGCNRSKARCPNLRFFTFPIKRPFICDAWVRFCANEKLDNIEIKKLNRRMVCEKHFEDECFTSTLKTRLNHTAIPTKFCAEFDNDIIEPEPLLEVLTSASNLIECDHPEQTTQPDVDTLDCVSNLHVTLLPPSYSSNTLSPDPCLPTFNKSIKVRKQTVRKNFTSSKAKLLSKLNALTKLRRSYQEKLIRMNKMQPRVTKKMLMSSIKKPPSVSGVWSASKKVLPCPEEEKHQVLSTRRLKLSAAQAQDDPAGAFNKAQEWDSDGGEESTDSQKDVEAGTSTKNRKTTNEPSGDTSPSTAPSKPKKKRRILHCCASGCQNSSDGHLMFILPRDPALRTQWVININRPQWTPAEDSALCEIHFVSDCWEEVPMGGRTLKATAVPTEYLSGDEWAAGPSSDPTRGVPDWDAGQDAQNDNHMMDIEEHNVFIKQEYIEPEIDLKQEIDQELTTGDITENFETVFLDSNVFKEGDPKEGPRIKVEMEDNEQENVYTSDQGRETATLSGYQNTTSVVGLSSAVTCSCAPTVSVVTTFPSSTVTTTVSSIPGLITTLPVMSSAVNQGANSTGTPPQYLILRQPSIKNKLTPWTQNAISPSTDVPILKEVPQEALPMSIRSMIPARSYGKRTKTLVKVSTPAPDQVTATSNQSSDNPTATEPEPEKVPPDPPTQTQDSSALSFLTALLKNCYVETGFKIIIDLEPLPECLRQGIKVKLKSLIDTIFLKHVSPYDVIIAIQQRKALPLPIITS